MNVNRKLSKSDKLLQPKKQTKSGVRNQKMFLRKAIAKKLRMKVSKKENPLKNKTYEELRDLYVLVNFGDLEGAKSLLEMQKDLPRMSAEERKKWDEEQSEEFNYERELQDIANLLKGDEEEKKEGYIFEDDDVLDEKSYREVERVMGDMLDIVEQAEEPPFQPDFEEEEKVGIAQQKKKIRKKVEEASDLPEDVSNIIAGMSLGPRPKQEGKYDDEDDLDQAEVWQYPALGLAPNANLEVPNSNLNDNMIVSANARSAFQPNPLVPVRQQFEPARREVLEDNENMRNDPNPAVIPQQDILEQVRILEGPEGMMPHGEPHRLPNPVVVNDPRLAQNNMGSMEQNVMINRGMMDRREMRRQMFGEGEEEKYQDAFGAMPEDDDFDELDQNEDIYNEDFEGISNRERIDEMKKIMSYKQAGRWNGNMGVGRDYARSALIVGNAPTIDTTDRMRKEELYPYKIPNRTYAGNSVNLIRNSNRSMLLQTGQLLP